MQIQKKMRIKNVIFALFYNFSSYFVIFYSSFNKMSYALYYNSKTENIEVYPQLEEHTMTGEEIEKYMSENADSRKWVIYDHLPTEEDIDAFEDMGGFTSSDEEL